MRNVSSKLNTRVVDNKITVDILVLRQQNYNCSYRILRSPVTYGDIGKSFQDSSSGVTATIAKIKHSYLQQWPQVGNKGRNFNCQT